MVEYVFGGSVYTRVFLFLALIFLIAFPKDGLRNFDKVVYQVNDEIITKLDIDEAVSMNKKLKKMGFPVPLGEADIVASLIEAILVEQELHRNNVYISDVDIVNQIANVAKGNHLKSVEDFKTIIVNAGVDWDYFLKIERNYICHQYLTRYLPLVNQPTAKEIHDYYLKHKSDFFVSKVFLVSEIVLRKTDNITFSELAQLNKKAADIQEEITKGADFEKTKKKYSDEVTQVEWKVKEDYEGLPEVWQTVQVLKKNDVSGPIDTAIGIYVIKVLDIKTNQELEYSKIQDLVSRRIIEERNKKALEDKIKELKEKAFIKNFNDNDKKDSK